MVTAKKSVLEAHVESKHSGKNAKKFEQCFPTFGKVAVTAVKSGKGNAAAKGDTPTKKKKKAGKKFKG